MIARHDPRLQTTKIAGREHLPGNRENDAILPRNVPALTIEVPTEHIAEHIRVPDRALLRRRLQPVGQFDEHRRVSFVLLFQARESRMQRMI